MCACARVRCARGGAGSEGGSGAGAPNEWVVLFWTAAVLDSTESVWDPSISMYMGRRRTDEAVVSELT